MTRTRPIWSKTGALTTTPIAVALPENWSSLKLEVDARAFAKLGKAYTPPAVAAVNGITTLSSLGSPTGGTFQLRVFPARGDARALTTALAYNDTAANVKTALVATGLFATGDITAAGGALPSDITLTWTSVYAGAAPLLEVVNALTGGTNARIDARVTTLPSGNGGYAYVAGNTQESWDNDAEGALGARYLYLATVAGAGNYFVSCYR